MSVLHKIENAKNLQLKARLLKAAVRDNEMEPQVLIAFLKRQMTPDNPKAWSVFCSKILIYVNRNPKHQASPTTGEPPREKPFNPQDNPFLVVPEKEKQSSIFRFLSYALLGAAVFAVMFSLQSKVKLTDLPGARQVMVQGPDSPHFSLSMNNSESKEIKAAVKRMEPGKNKPVFRTSKSSLSLVSQEKPLKENLSDLEAPVALPKRIPPDRKARSLSFGKAKRSPENLSAVQRSRTLPKKATVKSHEPMDIPEEAREPYVKALVGDAQSQALLASFYDEGHILEADPQKALHWYTKAGENGHPGAQNHLGVVYFKGIGVPRDLQKASHWWTYSAKQGFAPAQNNLGYMYEKGLGVKQNYMTSAYWYNKSSEQDYARAQNNLAVLLDQGRGIQKNSLEAMKWWKRAAEQGYAKAQNNLGVMYFQGKSVEKDIDEALKWWHRAARQGYARAQNNLGILYEEGQGVPRDMVMAYSWLSRAFVNGYDESGVYRAEMEKMLSPSQLSMAQELIYGDINLMPGMRQWAGSEMYRTQTASSDPF